MNISRQTPNNSNNNNETNILLLFMKQIAYGLKQ